MRNDNLDITVCILSYNRPDYIVEAIKSVYSQSFKPKEIRIYDNGSDDIVRNAIIKYLELGVKWIPTKFPSNNPRKNFRSAVKNIRTKYVVMLHDDDKFCDDFLEIQVSFLEENYEISAVSCNGYTVNKFGDRTGSLVLNKFSEFQMYHFKNSVEIAMVYASDSCIPFSPTVYRTEHLLNVDFREEYGKVCDAVLLCDLADFGNIALNGKPLYECRVHDNQDSTYFEPVLMQKLEDFFWTRKANNKTDVLKLKNLLVAQHTRNSIREIFNILKSTFNPFNLFKVFKKLTHRRFSFIYLLKEVIKLTKNFLGKII